MIIRFYKSTITEASGLVTEETHEGRNEGRSEGKNEAINEAVNDTVNYQ